MRLLAHILLAFVAIGLQRGLDDLLSVGSGRVDLVMIAAAFAAASLPRATGPIAALLIGLGYDLSGAGPIGLFAVSLGLGGLAASALPSNRWGRLLGALVAGIIAASLAAWMIGLLRQLLSADEIRDGLSFGGMVLTILLTSLMAVAVSLPLWKGRRFFVVEGPRF